MTDDISFKLSKILRAQQHLMTCADEVMELAKPNAIKIEVKKGALEQAISQFHNETVNLFQIADLSSGAYPYINSKEQLEKLQISYDQVKYMLLDSGSKQAYPVKSIMSLLEEYGHVRRMAKQMIKTIRELESVNN
jgi:hypothetical protein